MRRKVFRKYTYDISLDEGVGARLISWITGLMVFFATLTLVISFSLSTVAKNWVTGLSGTLTVEIKPPMAPGDGGKVSILSQRKFEDSVKNIMAFLKSNASVASARQLSETEIKELIEPWMGRDAALDALPIPALIDIKLNPSADTAALEKSIQEIAPDASLDRQNATLDNVKSLVHTAMLFMLLLTGVIVALAIVTISGIVRSKLLIHQAEVETLHLIGASDEYIAKQFRQHTLRGTLRGAFLGVGATLITLFALGIVTHGFDNSLIAHLQILPLQWAAVLGLPIIGGSLIAHLTAQAAALKELARLP